MRGTDRRRSNGEMIVAHFLLSSVSGVAEDSGLGSDTRKWRRVPPVTYLLTRI